MRLLIISLLWSAGCGVTVAPELAPQASQLSSASAKDRDNYNADTFYLSELESIDAAYGCNRWRRYYRSRRRRDCACLKAKARAYYSWRKSLTWPYESYKRHRLGRELSAELRSIRRRYCR